MMQVLIVEYGWPSNSPRRSNDDRTISRVELGSCEPLHTIACAGQSQLRIQNPLRCRAPLTSAQPPSDRTFWIRVENVGFQFLSLRSGALKRFRQNWPRALVIARSAGPNDLLENETVVTIVSFGSSARISACASLTPEGASRWNARDQTSLPTIESQSRRRSAL